MQKIKFIPIPRAAAIIVVALTALTAGCGKNAGNDATAVSRAFEEAYNKGEIDALDTYLDADMVRHFPPNPDIKGLAAYKQAILKSRGDYPIQKLTVHSSIRQGDISAARWTHSFTIGATGKEITITGCSMYRWEKGKIVEHWLAGDLLGRYQQLGYKMLSPITEKTYGMVTFAQLKPEKVKDLVKIEKDLTVPLFQSYKECHGFYFLCDEKTGKVCSLSIWDNEDAWTAGLKDEKVKAFFREFSEKTTGFFAVKPVMSGYTLMVQE